MNNHRRNPFVNQVFFVAEDVNMYVTDVVGSQSLRKSGLLRLFLHVSIDGLTSLCRNPFVNQVFFVM